MMKATEPDVANGGKYTTMQTVRALGVCKETLRRYTEFGFIRCYVNEITQRKVYKGSEIKRCWRMMRG